LINQGIEPIVGDIILSVGNTMVTHLDQSQVPIFKYYYISVIV
jgi:hypothetical protein